MSTTGWKMMPFMEIKNSGKGIYFRGLTQRFSLSMLKCGTCGTSKQRWQTDCWLYDSGTQNINLGRDRSLRVPDTHRWYRKPLGMRTEGPVPRAVGNSSFPNEGVGVLKALGGSI